MGLEKAFENQKEIIVRREGEKLTFKDIQAMTSDDLKDCEVSIFERPLKIRDSGISSGIHGLVYEYSIASVGHFRKETAQKALESIYSLAKVFYGGKQLKI